MAHIELVPTLAAMAEIYRLPRRRGFGTVLLLLALLESRALGIERVRITCDDDTVGSAEVIERNGGVLVGRGVSKRTGKSVRQYWVA